jgi:2-oxoglutarate ferredoxin oxidoreductase subunit beta
MVYGLTKGQASPTSQLGFKTPVQVEGVSSRPLNPLSIAISQSASFVARAFAGDVDRTKDMIKAALSHHGYALVDILQPCVTYNKVNTFKWFRDHTRYLDESHNPRDLQAAFAAAMDTEHLALGVLYVNQRATFEDGLSVYRDSRDALYRRSVDTGKLRALLA